MTNPFQDLIDESDRYTVGDGTSASGGKNASKFARKKFTCEGCNGSGMWSGGVNRYGNSKCNMCNGAGHFVTSPQKRRQLQHKRAMKRETLKLENKAQNIEALGGKDRMVALHNAGSWSEFAASLYAHHESGKALSDKQVNAAISMLDKLAARAAERAKEKAAAIAAAPVVDLTPIKTMFDNAVASGYKRPKYRAEGLVLSRAPDHGRNPGALYVTSAEQDDTYYGKVVDVTFHPAYAARGAGVEDKLAAIASDPSGAAVRYGQRTGACSCCGRKLTAHTSIEAGIGPICAERWGL